jgi:hypothetical protein
VLVSARRLRELDVTTAAELPLADPIERVPGVLKQAGLMGLPEALPLTMTLMTARERLG